MDLLFFSRSYLNFYLRMGISIVHATRGRLLILSFNESVFPAIILLDNEFCDVYNAYKLSAIFDFYLLSLISGPGNVSNYGFISSMWLGFVGEGYIGIMKVLLRQEMTDWLFWR